MKPTLHKSLMAASSIAVLLALGACGDRNASLTSRTDTAARETRQAANEARQETRDAVTTAREETREAGTATMGAAASTVDDAQIVTKVNMALAADKDLSALKIDVDSKGGVVTLKGTAPSAAAKEKASDLAKNVKDVKSVENQLTVG